MPGDDYILPEFPIESVGGKPWVRQGDIYRDVEYIESLDEDKVEGTVSVSKLVFPLAVVLGQDCDLLSDGAMRTPAPPPGRKHPSNSSAALLSVLLTPLYNSELFFTGQHCSEIMESLFLSASTTPSTEPIQSMPINGKGRDRIKKGEDVRFQYIHFGDNAPLVDCVIDFKHCFSVRTEYLINNRDTCVGRIGPVFRESISQRFGFYLSRIGLPDGQ